MSDSPAKINMILCMTRGRICTPEKCLTPNSCLKNENSRNALIKAQKEWESIQEANHETR
jgi:hypothetical protein